jgi:dihydrofolate reductase
MAKRIAAIWAEDKKGLIGVEGHLPWQLPAELAHFKATTMDAALLMGRKTFDGMNRRLLPGRTSIVLTRDKAVTAESLGFSTDALQILHSREEVLNWYAGQERSLFVIGGAEMFRLFAADIEELYQTVVDGEFVGDTQMPELTEFAVRRQLSAEDYSADDKNSHAFTVYHYQLLEK